jgi:hypothetical protein
VQFFDLGPALGRLGYAHRGSASIAALMLRPLRGLDLSTRSLGNLNCVVWSCDVDG